MATSAPTTPLERTRDRLRAFDFVTLFNELGWDHFRGRIEVVVGETPYALSGIAEKNGVQIFRCGPGPDGNILDKTTRRLIDREVGRRAHEHILVFTDEAETTQLWRWELSEPGRPRRSYEYELHRGQAGEALAQRLQGLSISIDDEERPGFGIVDVTRQVRGAFEAERVTRTFYRDFHEEHTAFRAFIAGIPREDDLDWYASLMLNRLMFIYFIQEKGFLDGDHDYLRNKLAEVRRDRGDNQFHSFYRHFLRRLFHEGLGHEEGERTRELDALLGRVPYLNGGLFDVHALEQTYDDIDVPDEAFARLFDFFDGWRWHLDERPLRDDREINPDVLGYIFEKYINQKQMGAYYTKEDITGYIARNTIVPALFDMARPEARIAFEPGSALWRLLQENPDRYIYPAMQKGTNLALPAEIAAGVGDVAQRGGWNRQAGDAFQLPTETWREHVARRQRYEAVWEKLVGGEVSSIDDLITLNLDIHQFAVDAIAECEGPETLRGFWRAIERISVLDPTCGSGAFLFAALNILQPLAEACLERMQAFVDESERAEERPHPERFKDFRKILEDVARHPNREYFVLKQIVLNNLYGVDIMEEAVEICKLRLFLKLVAQVETAEQIEPLPDIDFNIRAGNTLVGFASLDDVARALSATRVSQNVGQLRIVEDATQDALGRINEEAEKAAMAVSRFRALQDEGHDPSDQRQAKLDVRRRLSDLRRELDHLLARDYGVDPDGTGFTAWMASHQPFHWVAEFFEIVQSEGGFDVIVGNPPYVNARTVDYLDHPLEDRRFPDIYADVVLKTLDIASSRGRVGMIVPLSITFSGDFEELREALLRRGLSWLSSFDNIPAAVFAGVSQRCTIALSAPAKTPRVFMAPMHRWRSAFRPCLMETVAYSDASSVAGSAFGLPKVGGDSQIDVLRKAHSNGELKERVGFVAPERLMLHFAPAARNFISVYIQPPPVLDAITLLPTTGKTPGAVNLSTSDRRNAALAGCSGELFFWYWLVRGDGFDVTNWLVQDFLRLALSIPDGYIEHLGILGEILNGQRFKALVFKKNAGKYVGNYNYRSLAPITRRADLVLAAGLGLSRSEILGILDYVQRVLAINDQAGERAIPVELKSRYAISLDDRDVERQELTLDSIDQAILKHYGFTDEELDYIINYDIKYRMGLDGDPEAA